MRTAIEKLTGSSRAAALAIGLALLLAAMLVVATATLGSRAETASAQTTTLEADQSSNGQASAGASEERLVGETFNRTELYFGSEKPGPDVTRQKFDRFVDEEVTPSFPDGLTLLTGYGQFRGSDEEIVQEKSFVLILLYPPDDAEANGEIEEIRDDYKDAFDQESVLRTDGREQVSF